MLRITGYSDKYTAFPGEEIKFYVNAEKNENYEVQIVRLIHGDTNPEGPGYKDEEIGAECNRTFQGRNQRIHVSTRQCDGNGQLSTSLMESLGPWALRLSL